jgi:hypothetical protein
MLTIQSHVHVAEYVNHAITCSGGMIMLIVQSHVHVAGDVKHSITRSCGRTYQSFYHTFM